jgi:glyoxylase-like metal-dependent hydrolase (beta-lactamase superfamily II)
MGVLAAVAPPALGRLIRPINQAAAQESRSNALFRIERVTDGVYAALARPTAMINCNAAIIVNSDHVLVVDTHSKPSAARALINQIKAEVSDRPVRYAVNTHFHWDHAQGNRAYTDAFGAEAQLVSSTATREWLQKEGASRLRQSLQGLTNQIAEAKKRLAAAKNDEERKRAGEQVAELEAFQKEMTPAEDQIKLPTLTFEHRMTLHQGGREIHLLFLGRGHTAGDVVVHIPSERVVATGDLMHSILPYIGDGYPDEWPRTITELEKLEFDKVVSGHGSVQQGKSVLAFFRAYLEEINEGVARAVERGATLDETKRSLATDRLRSINGHLPRLAREAQSLLGPIPFANAAMAQAVAANVAEVYDYYTKRRNQSR